MSARCAIYNIPAREPLYGETQLSGSIVDDESEDIL